MKYALVNTQNETLRTQDFAEPPQALSEAKGLRWVEYLPSEQELVGIAATEEANRKAAIIRQLNDGDAKIIRAILEGDTARIEQWKSRAAGLRAQL